MCFSCWNAEAESPVEKFDRRNICKKKWQARKAAIARHDEDNSRHTSNKRAAASIDKRHPGEDKAMFRWRSVDRSVELAATIREGILHLSAAARAKIVDAIQAWADEWAKQDADEEYIPQVSDEVLTVTEAQMLHSELPGLDEAFFCRQRGCRTVFRNIDWVHNFNAGSGHYLCPTCGQQYRPWMEKPG